MYFADEETKDGLGFERLVELRVQIQRAESTLCTGK